MPYKLENLPRNSRGEYGIKARIPGVAAKSFRARTINEARKAAMRWVEGVESGTERTSSEITLAEYRAETAPGMKWSPGTREHFDHIWQTYIEPHFGKDPLSTIGRPEIREWLSALDRKGASPDLRHKAASQLQGLLNEAVRDGKLAASPNIRGLKPSVEHRKGVALTRDQMAVLLDALSPRYRTVALVSLTTGMRIGEVLALRPDDIKRDEMLISVTKSLPRTQADGRHLKANRKTKRPKTRASTRTIPLMTVTLAALDDHVAQFGLSPQGYLFTTQNPPHDWLGYGTFIDSWRRALGRIRTQDPDFPEVRIHDLRKTYGAWMVANPNVTPMEAAKVLGHRDAAITLNIYAPLIPGRSAIPDAAAEMSKGLWTPKELVPEIVDGEVVEG